MSDYNCSSLDFAKSHVGIHKEDLPFSGKQTAKSSKKGRPNAPVSLIGPADPAPELMFDLTGVKNAMIDMGPIDTNPVRPPSPYKGGAKLGSDVSEERPNHHDPSSTKALDTCDLGFWTYMVLPDFKSDQDEETFSNFSEEFEQHEEAAKAPLQEKTVTTDSDKSEERKQRDEFWTRIKETMRYVQMRLQIIQDEGNSKNENLENFNDSDESPVKHARKLAGQMHTEEQAVRLQDLQQWLLNIGKNTEEDSRRNKSRKAKTNQKEEGESAKIWNMMKDIHETLNMAADHFSPFDLRRQIESDLRDRLANIYEGKNFILNHGDLETAKANDEPFQSILSKLQQMEAEYEVLGTTILQSLKQAEKMDSEFYTLQSELVTNGCPLITISQPKKSKKGKDKGKKRKENESGSESSSAMSTSRTGDESDRKSSDDGKSSKAETKNDTKGEKKKNKKGEKGEKSENGENKKGGKRESRNSKASESGNSEKNTPEKRPSSDKRTASEKRSSSAEKSASPEQNTTSPGAVEGRPQSTSSGAVVAEASNSRASTGESKRKSANETKRNPSILNAESNNEKKSSILNAESNNEKKSSIAKVDGNNVDAPRERPSSPSLDRVDGGQSNKEDVVIGLADNNRNSPVTPEQGGGQSQNGSHRFKRKSSVPKEASAQTDNVAVLSLDAGMEDAFNAELGNGDAIENMKRLQKQLQFWRTKNWAVKYAKKQQKLLALTPATNTPAVHDLGVVLYLNPQSGLHVMKKVSELDLDTQQTIMCLATGKVNPSQQPNIEDSGSPPPSQGS